jgi:hypothetical protein
MSPVGPRFRERRSLLPPGSKVRYGIYNIVNPNTGVILAPYGAVESNVSGYSKDYEWTWDLSNPGPPYRTGGAFTSIKSGLPHFDVLETGQYRGNDIWLPPGYPPQQYRYDGGWGGPIYPPFIGIPEERYAFLGTQEDAVLFPDLGDIGSLAYEKLRPKQEKAGLAVALAEAKDIPRMLQTSAKGFHQLWRDFGGSPNTDLMQPKSVADHFINHQFGWVPFLNDLQQFNDVYQNSITYAAYIERDNGVWKNRYRADKTIEDEEVLYSNPSHSGLSCQPADYIGVFNSGPSHTIVRRKVVNVWYKGQFKYYRPEFDRSLPGYYSVMNATKRLLTLYGANVNPTILWKITPWSWLVDWFSNVGAQIQRAQDLATDATVSKYMYLMHHYVYEEVLKTSLPLKTGGTLNLEFKKSGDIKRRQGADSSFGFNLSSGDLSWKQLAILSALGISRVG